LDKVLFVYVLKSLKKGIPMKTSHSFFLLATFTLGLLSTVASADIAKGQKWYSKNCKECHGNGTKGSAMKTQDEWTEMFEKDGELIIKKHVGTKAQDYFSGDKFKSQSKDLHDFLFEYGSDSGSVPAC
jgi:mono/diheme cytochrome c family protein